MTDLERLKLLTQETDDPVQPPGAPSMRYYTDDQLKKWLMVYDGDVRATAYQILLNKAENTKIHFTGGAEFSDQSTYFLRLAKSLRPNRGGARKREDDP